MAAHARLKNEFTEDEKCHNLMHHLFIDFGNEIMQVLFVMISNHENIINYFRGMQEPNVVGV